MAKVTKANYAAKLKAAILNAAITGKLTGGTTGWKVVKGKTLFEETENKKPQGEYFDYIDIDAIDNKRFKIISPKHLRCEKAPSRASRGVKEGDVLFSMVRPYLRNVALVEEKHKKFIASTGFFVCRSKFYEPKFLFWLMLSPYVIDGLMVCMKGDNSPSIRKNDILEFDFPLPPLAVQREIVGKVEELMPLVEEYGRAEEARQKLDAEFPEKLRKSILDLAIHGKLVAQDPAEPPAAVGASVTTPPYALPSNWTWVKLGEVCEIIMGQSPSGSSVSTNNLGMEFHQGKICFSDMYLKVSESKTEAPTKIAPQHSILLCVRAPVGKVNITPRTICIGRGLCALIPKKDLSTKLCFYFLLAMEPWFVKQATGTTFTSISSGIVKEMPFPLPPLGEQKRIVGKVEAMMKALEGLVAAI